MENENQENADLTPVTGTADAAAENLAAEGTAIPADENQDEE